VTAGFNIALPGSLDLSRAQRKPVMKPTCGPDDGSDAGPWFYRPAREIDGNHRYVEPAPSLEIDE
jgi:hypothetical protein